MSEWPDLPKKIRGMRGPITVRQIKRVKVEGTACWGSWQESTRTIRVEKGAPPAHRWATFFHEWAHAVLDDAGIAYQLSTEGAETLCHAIATARTAEMRHQLGLD